jgi:hypothetical protein
MGGLMKAYDGWVDLDDDSRFFVFIDLSMAIFSDIPFRIVISIVVH